MSFVTSLICGFNLDLQDYETNKRKFNEDTGEPYNIKVIERVASIDGVKIGTSENINLNNGERFIFAPGLFLEIINGHKDSGKKFIGTKIAIAKSNGAYYKELKAIVPKAVQKFADKYDVVPRWFLSTECMGGFQNASR